MRKIQSFLSVHFPGVVLWFLSKIFYALVIFYMLMPLCMIMSDSSSILRIVFFFLFVTLMYFIPTLATIVNLVLWFVSIPFAARSPFDAFMVFYLICAAIFVIFEFIPYVCKTIDFIRTRGK